MPQSLRFAACMLAAALFMAPQSAKAVPTEDECAIACAVALAAGAYSCEGAPQNCAAWIAGCTFGCKLSGILPE